VRADLVYDIGMHKGEDTAAYLRQGFRVVGVEANPELVAHLRERFEHEVRAGRVVIEAVALGPAPGTVSFAVFPERSDLGSACPANVEAWRRRSIRCELIDVEMTTVDALMGRHGVPYYMKVDVEGLDHAVVERLGACAPRPPLLSIESAVAAPGTGVARVVREIRLLRGLGYRRFKLVDQTRPRREGSGPFGDEAPGPWRRPASIAPRMLGRLIQHQLFSDHGTFASSALGGRLRAGALRTVKDVAPSVHPANYLGGYQHYDLHASL
jgi:FkbM family methyltransferase